MQYHDYDPNMIQQVYGQVEADTQGSGGGDIPFWRAKTGKNYIRCLPPFAPGKMFVRRVEHSLVIPNKCFTPCLSQWQVPCPLCGIAAQANPLLGDRNKIKQRITWIMNILVVEQDLKTYAEGAKVYAYAMPPTVQKGILDVFMDRSVGDPFHPTQGIVVCVTRPVSFEGKNNYSIHGSGIQLPIPDVELHNLDRIIPKFSPQLEATAKDKANTIMAALTANQAPANHYAPPAYQQETPPQYQNPPQYEQAPPPQQPPTPQYNPNGGYYGWQQNPNTPPPTQTTQQQAPPPQYVNNAPQQPVQQNYPANEQVNQQQTQPPQPVQQQNVAQEQHIPPQQNQPAQEFTPTVKEPSCYKKYGTMNPNICSSCPLEAKCRSFGTQQGPPATECPF